MSKSLRTPRQKLLQSLLIAARKEIGMTQADVAAALDKPQSFVAKYETGERRIDIVELVDIARILDVSPTDIVSQIMSASEHSGRTARLTKKT
jgi:transcriptional regulator with XRE-family HTH domain